MPLITEMAAQRGPEGKVRRVPAGELPYPAHFEALLTRQIETRTVHEDDFWLLSRLPADLIVIDAGSNIGNSAVSCEVAAPGCRIIGFEPNPSLRPLLERARRFCTNFTFFPFGLAEEDGIRTFYVPVSDGRHIAGESSMKEAHFDDPVVSARLRSYSASRRFSLEACEVEFRRLDDLEEVRSACRAAKTVVFKIDVEGAELEVLRGAQGFLEVRHPMLLIENGERPEIVEYVSKLGYRRYLRTNRNALAPAGNASSLNSFFVAPGGSALPLEKPEGL